MPDKFEEMVKSVEGLIKFMKEGSEIGWDKDIEALTYFLALAQRCGAENIQGVILEYLCPACPVRKDCKGFAEEVSSCANERERACKIAENLEAYLKGEVKNG